MAGPAPRGGRPVVVKPKPKPASRPPAKDPRGPGTAGPAFPGAKGAKRPATNKEKADFLRKQGYNIPKGSSLYVLQSASANWAKGKGRRNPAQWNISIARSNAESKDSAGVVTRKPKPKASGGGGGGGGGAPAPAAPRGQGISLAGMGHQSLLNEGLNKQGAQLLDDDFADELAGLQYDSGINTLLADRARQGRQNAQNENDIGAWWQQAMDSQGKSSAAVKAINDAAVARAGAATKGILASLGGDASPAAGMVGAVGASGANELSALGAADESFDARMGGLLDAERAGNLSRERALASQRMADADLEVANARREKGAARAENLFNIRNQNNQVRDNRVQRLMELRQLNNQMRQQGFQNRLAEIQTGMAAEELGLKGLETMASLNSPAKKGRPLRGTWAGSTSTERSAAADAAFNSVTDEDGNLLPQYRGKVPALVSQVNAAYKQRGYSTKNPAVVKAMMTVLQQLGVNNPNPAWWGLGGKGKKKGKR